MLVLSGDEIDASTRLLGNEAANLEEGVVEDDCDAKESGAWVDCALCILLQWHVPLILYALSLLHMHKPSIAIAYFGFASEMFWAAFYACSFLYLVWMFLKDHDPESAIENHLWSMTFVSVTWDITVVLAIVSSYASWFL
ncbi:Uncharacterized protein PBTT_07800 [Plasmodiophora brassicae]|uniref:Uncharacterized protein n=1 Tax=Plasmodiophora brassicae TaxID=37360 RepID=A0A0G4IXW0_PLABS|nr:hypothetical protein PBRA_007713 [Plasmodiophora brassicae]SPQ99019.1 unnamed protein product [Plasmodiophora brassicae]